MHRLYQMDKGCMREHVDKIRRVLCDRDPCVMGASLPFITDLIKEDVTSFKDLVPSLISILKQIIEHRLPRDFDYHRIPAPWIQMSILKMLALLGRGDQASSEGMYEVLADVMRRADTGINVGYAIVYEAVHTVTMIYPNPLLLDAAATSISRFIRSDSHNLKYIGIKGLAAIVKDHPRYAVDHQVAVIDCLEDPDETLKRKTLDLLFRMTNSVNVEFIVDKLLSFLASATDDHFRTDLVGQITQCAERFAPSNAWYVQTMVKVFELAGDKVKMSVAQTLMQLIAEGAEPDADDEDGGSKDDELRTEAVEDFLTLIDKPKLSDTLAQAMAWVLGEYGYLSESHSKDKITDLLCDLAYKTTDSATRAHITTAIMKLVAQSGSCSARVTKYVSLFGQSSALDVQQRCIEFQALLQSSGSMADVLPVDASCEDIEVDEKLSFLNGYVQSALAQGAVPYSPPAAVDDDDDSTVKEKTLRYAAYEKPQAPTAASSGIMSSLGMASAAPTALPQAAGPGGPNALGATPAAFTQASAGGNQLIGSRGVAQVWGRKPEPPPPAPVVAAPQVTASVAASAPAAVTYAPTPPVLVTGAGAASMAAVNIAAAAVSAEPRALTEKEKMAAALFGGVSSTKGAGARAGRKPVGGAPPPASAAPVPVATASAPQASSAPPAPVPAPAAAPMIDLLDLGFDSPAPVAAAPAIAQPQRDMFAPPAPPPAPVPAPAPAPKNLVSNAFDDMDLLAPVPLAPLAPTPMGGMGMGGMGMGAMGSFPPAAPAITSTARPARITTAEFGGRWGQTPFEVKAAHTSKIQNLTQLRSAMPSQAYHHVESIANSNEAIFSASTPAGGLILVHMKLFVQRGACEVTIKSTAREACAQEMVVIAAVLATQ